MWVLPIVVGGATNFLSLPVSSKAFLWAGAFAWMGTGCLLNARRCSRLHCFISTGLLRCFSRVGRRRHSFRRTCAQQRGLDHGCFGGAVLRSRDDLGQIRAGSDPDLPRIAALPSPRVFSAPHCRSEPGNANGRRAKSIADTRHDQIFPTLTAVGLAAPLREERRYAAGDFIARTGEISPGFFLILKGEVAIKQRDALGHAQLIVTHGSGPSWASWRSSPAGRHWWTPRRSAPSKPSSSGRSACAICWSRRLISVSASCGRSSCAASG